MTVTAVDLLPCPDMPEKIFATKSSDIIGSYCTEEYGVYGATAYIREDIAAKIPTETTRKDALIELLKICSYGVWHGNYEKLQERVMYFVKNHAPTLKEALQDESTRRTPPAVDQKREEALRDLPYIGTHGNWLFSSNKEVLAVWMIKHEQTIRAALSQPSIPPGYALVPVEPTEEMLTAAQETLCQMRSVTMFDDEVEIEKYKAMIAAAPKQEKSE